MITNSWLMEIEIWKTSNEIESPLTEAYRRTLNSSHDELEYWNHDEHFNATVCLFLMWNKFFLEVNRSRLIIYSIFKSTLYNLHGSRAWLGNFPSLFKMRARMIVDEIKCNYSNDDNTYAMSPAWNFFHSRTFILERHARSAWTSIIEVWRKIFYIADFALIAWNASRKLTDPVSSKRSTNSNL